MFTESEWTHNILHTLRLFLVKIDQHPESTRVPAAYRALITEEVREVLQKTQTEGSPSGEVYRRGKYIFISLLLCMNIWKKGAGKAESVSDQAVGWMAETLWCDCWQGPEIYFFS